MNKFEKKALAKRAYRALVKSAEPRPEADPMAKSVLQGIGNVVDQGLGNIDHKYITPFFRNPTVSNFVRQNISPYMQPLQNATHQAANALQKFFVDGPQERRWQKEHAQQESIKNLERYFNAQRYSDNLMNEAMKTKAYEDEYNDEYNRYATWDDNLGGYPGGYSGGLQPDEERMDTDQYIRDNYRAEKENLMRNALYERDAWQPELNKPHELKGYNGYTIPLSMPRPKTPYPRLTDYPNHWIHKREN